MKQINIYTVYANNSDMTFIIRDILIDNEPISTEVVGFYFGEPDEEATTYFIGKTKAIYN